MMQILEKTLERERQDKEKEKSRRKSSEQIVLKLSGNVQTVLSILSFCNTVFSFFKTSFVTSISVLSFCFIVFIFFNIFCNKGLFGVACYAS